MNYGASLTAWYEQIHKFVKYQSSVSSALTIKTKDKVFQK